MARRRNIGKDARADLYASTTVRSRLIFAAVESFSLLMSVDIYFVLASAKQIEVWHTLFLGVLRTAITIGVAWVSWSNMQTFRSLRDDK